MSDRLYLTAHSTHSRQTSVPPAGFEPTISVGKLPRTYTSDRPFTGTGANKYFKATNCIPQPWFYNSADGSYVVDDEVLLTRMSS